MINIQFGDTSNRSCGRLWNSLVTQATLDYQSLDAQDIEHNWEYALDTQRNLCPRAVIFEESFPASADVATAPQTTINEAFGAGGGNPDIIRPPRPGGTWWDDCLVRIPSSNVTRVPISRTFTLAQGREAGEAQDTREACLDAVRRLLERENSVRDGFQVICDAGGGWGGFVPEFLPHILDDFDPPSLSCIPIFDPLSAPGSVFSTAESLVLLSGLSSCVFPVNLFPGTGCTHRQIGAAIELLFSPHIYPTLVKENLHLCELSNCGRLWGGSLNIGSEPTVYLYDGRVGSSECRFAIKRPIKLPMYVGDDDKAANCRASEALLYVDPVDSRGQPLILDLVRRNLIAPLTGSPMASEILEELESFSYRF